jgi:O-methyltransferase/methyltransferase family protein
MTDDVHLVTDDAHQQMSMMVTSHWISQVVRSVVDLSLAEHLAGQVLTADEVAAREGSAPRTTFRLMRACVALGLLTPDEDGRFHGTALLDTLRRDAPGSLRGLALATTLPAQWLAWSQFAADLRGVVFDRPGVVEEAVAETKRRGLANRTDVVAGDFFGSVPSGELYLLKFILHDWDDERAIKILENCRAAMAPGGRIAVIEILVGELDDPGPGALMDMNMLAIVPGQERSLEEYDALLHAAGLRRTRVIPTSSPQSVIEAVA